MLEEIKNGTRQDHASEEVKRLLSKYNVSEPVFINVGNDQFEITENLKLLVDEDIKFIFTLGGTGLGKTDCTFEAISSVIDQKLDGIADAMRIHAIARNPLAMTSKLIAGSCKGSTIISLPGGQDGAKECLEGILPTVFKIQKMLLKN